MESANALVPGRRFLPLLKKLIVFEGLLARFGKNQQETSILRTFADQPELGRDLLKNREALQPILDRVKHALAVAYPKATITMKLAEDEEHETNKVICHLQLSGWTYRLEITHDLVGSADFRELQKVSPVAIGLGSPPYTLKAKSGEITYPSSHDLVKAVLDIGKHGVTMQRYKGLGEMNAGQLWDTTMNPETRTLLKVQLEDVTGVDEIFSILMGDEVLPRRNFIQQHALEVRNLDV